MILSRDSPHYMNLPGISVLVGGMWVMNLSYWGFNQYIIQRALAAKDAREGQKGILFAAFLKLLMPVLVVLPGIAAVLLVPDLPAPDSAYPEVMKLLPRRDSRAGLCRLDCGHRLVAGVDDEQHCHDLHHGRLCSRRPQSQERATPSRSRAARQPDGPSASPCWVSRPLLGNFDQGFSIHPGVYRLLYSRRGRHFSIGDILEKHHRRGSALGAAVGSAVLSLVFKLLWPALPLH